MEFIIRGIKKELEKVNCFQGVSEIIETDLADQAPDIRKVTGAYGAWLLTRRSFTNKKRISCCLIRRRTISKSETRARWASL